MAWNLTKTNVRLDAGDMPEFNASSPKCGAELNTQTEFMKHSILAISVALCSSVVALAGPVAAKSPVVEPPVEPSSLCDTVFKATTFKFDNGIVDQFKVIGRYQGQYHWTEAEQGDESSYETRRWRLGMEAKFFDEKVFFRNNWNIDGLDDDGDDVKFESIYELLVAVNLTDDLKLTLGKQKPLITREYRLSSKKIITFERSALVNQLFPDASWGVSIDGKSDKISYMVGAYAASFDGEYNEWFDTSGGMFFLASLGYDLTGICPIGKDSADLRLDYSYTDEKGAPGPGAQNVVSLNYDGTNGRFRLIWDVLGGFGDGTDVFGVVLLPSYHITDKFEVVGRYDYANGDVVLQKRYEARVVNSRNVSDYHAFYGGANYYICDHNLKLMAGVEYATASSRGGSEGYDGFTFFTGVRLYF